MTRSELWDLLDSPLDKTNGTPIGRKRGCAFSVKNLHTYEASSNSKYVSVQKCKFLFCSLNDFNVLRVISMTIFFLTYSVSIFGLLASLVQIYYFSP